MLVYVLGPVVGPLLTTDGPPPTARFGIVTRDAITTDGITLDIIHTVCI